MINLKQRKLGIRTGNTSDIVASVKQYLKAHPANYPGQIDSLLELFYLTYTEYNPVETEEMKPCVQEAEEALRSLMGTEDEGDQFMNFVYEICTIYERAACMEGMKAGARLMLELEDE